MQPATPVWQQDLDVSVLGAASAAAGVVVVVVVAAITVIICMSVRQPARPHALHRSLELARNELVMVPVNTSLWH
jgi:hypothetical protein